MANWSCEDLMNLDLNLGPVGPTTQDDGPETEPSLGESLDVDRLMILSQRTRQQRLRWRQLQLAVESDGNESGFGVGAGSGEDGGGPSQVGEGSVATEERSPEVVKTCEHNVASLEGDSVKEEDNVERVKDEIFEKAREGSTCVIEESMFKLLNTSSSEVKDRKRSSESLTALSGLQGDARKIGQKHLLVLGDDPKPKPKRRAYRQVSNGNEKSKPLYNHYENGIGFWDSEREGIDNDAVGHKEIWEGVGSTTLGGLDWH